MTHKPVEATGDILIKTYSKGDKLLATEPSKVLPASCRGYASITAKEAPLQVRVFALGGDKDKKAALAVECLT